MLNLSDHSEGIAGLWLAAGASLLIIALVFHGPPDPDLSVQMEHVAQGHTLWALVHWTAAVALLLLSGAGFLHLIGSCAKKASPVLISAWMVMALGALLTVSTAVSEASVVAVVAKAGDASAFAAWWGFSSGMANGFFALALATAFIALSELLGDNRRQPPWMAVAGVAFSFLSAIGWSLGEHFGISLGGPVWLVSSVLMCVWLAWFGLASRKNLPATQ